MISKNTFFKLAHSLPEVEEVKHFDRIGLKISRKRMFASYLEEANSINVFLNPEEQKAFCEVDPTHIFPVPNKWGEKGATTFLLEKVTEEVVKEALLSAYQDVLRNKKG